MKKIGVIGGGVWGCALAKLLSKHQVTIFARDEKLVSSINKQKFNPQLKYVTFNENINSTSDINELNNLDYVFIALPAQTIRDVLKNYSVKNKEQQITIASKGIEINTMLFLDQVVKEVTEIENINILSGPCFSNEVVRNLPTAVTLATLKKENFDLINKLFDNKNFRLYFSNDLIGSQLGGALKNVYAIAAGMCNGLSLGENAKSALITRSFSELKRLGKAFNANTETFYGLSGLGDLILTCNSLKSRNTYFGHLVSSQQHILPKDHLISLQTTEGYFTVQAVKKIADKKNIDMPIMTAVYNILYKNLDIKEQIQALLEREPKAELN